jgi:hypothetical protein
MRKIKLTQGYVALVDDKDYQRVSQFKWSAHVTRNKNGSIKSLYAKRGVWLNGSCTARWLHRIVLQVSNPKVKVDHKNRNGLDCRRSNLRVATNSQNTSNTKLYSNSTSGFKGVHWNKQYSRWVAYIYVDNKRIHLGYFTSKREAAKARDLAAKQHHKQFAVLNLKEKS